MVSPRFFLDLSSPGCFVCCAVVVFLFLRGVPCNFSCKNLDLLKIAEKKKQIFRCIPYRFPKWWIEQCGLKKKKCRLGKSRKCVVTWILYDAHTLSPNQLQKLIVALFLGTGTGGKGEPPSIQLANTQPLPVM